MSSTTDGTLSVMLPTYNEEATLETIILHVLDRPEVGELIAVDDGSVDRSWEILTRLAEQDPRLRVFRQATNQGKGAALRLAISKITKPYALVQDADLEYDPIDYGLLIPPLVDGRADVVYGVRGFGGHTSYSFWYVMGNKGMTFVSNVLFNAYILDLATGYKALRSDLWRRLNLTGNGFEIDPEITARVLKLGYRIHEVPIHYYARGREEGKKVTWQDGFKAVSCLWRNRIAAPERIFGPAYDAHYHRERQDRLAEAHPLLSSRETTASSEVGAGG